MIFNTIMIANIKSGLVLFSHHSQVNTSRSKVTLPIEEVTVVDLDTVNHKKINIAKFKTVSKGDEV